MGQNQSGLPGEGKKGDKKKEKPKYEPPIPTRVGKKRRKGPDTAIKLPKVLPHTKCKLRLLKLERIKDYLLMEQEFIQNQERLKPQEEKNQEARSRVDELRGSPMGIGSDIGGSIRMPAFFNGVFGHKPSPYLVSNKGRCKYFSM